MPAVTVRQLCEQTGLPARAISEILHKSELTKHDVAGRVRALASMNETRRGIREAAKELNMGEWLVERRVRRLALAAAEAGLL